MKVSVDFSQFERLTLVDYGTRSAAGRSRARTPKPAIRLRLRATSGAAITSISRSRGTPRHTPTRWSDFAEFTAAIHAGRISTDAGDEPLDFVP